MSALRGLARVPPPRPRSLPRWAAPVGDARWPQRRRLAVRPAATPPATDVLVVGGGAAGLTAAIFAAAVGSRRGAARARRPIAGPCYPAPSWCPWLASWRAGGGARRVG